MPLSDLINTVRIRFYKGLIDQTLIRDANDLAVELKTYGSDKSDRLSLKGASLCSEINDYLGKFREAKESVSNGEALIRELPTEATTQNIEALMQLREEVRYAVNWCQALYRENLYTKSLTLLQHCEKLTCSGGLARDDFPCWGTKAKIFHLKARVEAAYGTTGVKSYRKAIEYYQRAAEYKSKNYQKDKERVDAELIFMQRRVAMSVGIGMSFLNSFHGRLSEALDNVRVAETILMPSTDELKKAQLKLRYATVLRGFASPSSPELRESMDLAKEALVIFEDRKHHLYSIRSIWEISLGNLYQGDVQEAQSYWKQLGAKIEELKKQTGHEDSYWRVNYWVLNSRISRRKGDFDAAFAAAEEGIKFVSPHKHNLRLGHIDALVARSEALSGLNRAKEAIEDLEHAIEIMNEEPSLVSQKTEAVIHLHLARNYITLADAAEARRCMEHSRALQQQIEDRSVENLSSELNQELMEACKNFEIPLTTDDLSYRWWQEQLQRWLVARASERYSSNESQMLKALGIVNKTLRDWREKWETTNKKKAARGNF
jgi:tetratricopeptide (TPR) repeat protein